MPDTVIDIPAAYVLLPIGLLLLAVGLSRRPRTPHRAIWVVAATLYAVAVLSVTLFPMTLSLGDKGNQAAWWTQVTVVPLATISPGTFVENIVLFVPLGVLLALAPKPVSLRTATLVSLACSALIEGIQLTLNIAASTGRSADVNDLVANTFGAVVAFMVLRMLLATVLSDRAAAIAPMM